jgi:NADPH-dependent 2,4-dienoyl-CoA reductase/sulfur reductase-like enzyme
MKGKLVGATLAAGAAWLAYDRLHRIEPIGGVYPDAPTKVVIVGGGFGGLAAVKELARVFGGSGELSVALIDRVNYTTFLPMVPSVTPQERRGATRCPLPPAYCSLLGSRVLPGGGCGGGLRGQGSTHG